MNLIKQIFISLKMKIKKLVLLIKLLFQKLKKVGVGKRESSPIFPNIKELNVILFFNVLDSNNLSLLFLKHKKKYTKKELELAERYWLDVNDYIFKLKNNQELRADLSFNQEKNIIEARILTLKAIYNSFLMLQNNYNFIEFYAEKRNKLIELYNTIMFGLVCFDNLISDNEFLDAIKISLQNLDYLSKKNDKKINKSVDTIKSIYSIIADIGVILNMQLNAKNMNITEFIEYENIAIEKSKQWKKTTS